MTAIHRGILSQDGAAPVSWAQAGVGPDVLLVHGATVTLEDMLLALLPALSGQARVTAIDRPGHGLSGTDGWTGTPWRQAAALRATARALGLDRPVVIGHSFGSTVAVAYGLEFPSETTGVVAVSPIALPEPRLEHLVFGPRGLIGARTLNAGLNASIDRALLPLLWNAMFLPQAMPQRFADQFPFEIAGRAAQTRAEGQDALGLNIGLGLSLMNYWRCSVPVEVIVGDADKVVLPAHAITLAALLPGARLTIVPGVGHMLHHFVPELIAKAALALADGGRGSIGNGRTLRSRRGLIAAAPTDALSEIQTRLRPMVDAGVDFRGSVRRPGFAMTGTPDIAEG